MPKRPNRAGLGSLSPAAVVFALLVLATVAAFAYAQRVKRDPLVVDKVAFGVHRDGVSKKAQSTFTPNGDCRHDRIRIRFRTTVSDDGNVQIVKPGGGIVATLAREQFLKRYTFHTYYWNGRFERGGTAPPGRYKLRVTLLGQDRVLVTPGTIHLHDVPPRPGRSCSQSEDRPTAGAGRSR
ncbi:MAG: hypothetical protein AB7V58_07755 [Solirubrobacterales bacterium]